LCHIQIWCPKVDMSTVGLRPYRHALSICIVYNSFSRDLLSSEGSDFYVTLASETTGLLQISNCYHCKNVLSPSKRAAFFDFTLTFNCCVSFIYNSIIVNASCDQSAEHIVVGYTITNSVNKHCQRLPTDQADRWSTVDLF